MASLSAKESGSFVVQDGGGYGCGGDVRGREEGGRGALLQGGGGHRADADAGAAFRRRAEGAEIGPHAPRAGKGQVVRLFLGFAGNVDGFIEGMLLHGDAAPLQRFPQGGTAPSRPEQQRRFRGTDGGAEGRGQILPCGAAWAKVRKDACLLYTSDAADD